MEEGHNRIPVYDGHKDHIIGFLNLEFEGNPIQIKHLINHTSTLPRIPENLDKQTNYDEENPYVNYSKEMISDYLKNYTIKSKPGITQEYSNFGTALLGIILENVYKKIYFLEFINIFKSIFHFERLCNIGLQ